MSGWEAQRAQLRPVPQYQREFTCTEVDVFCGPGSKGTMTLKKVRKDKRESHSSRGLLDDNPHKLKGESLFCFQLVYLLFNRTPQLADYITSAKFKSRAVGVMEAGNLQPPGRCRPGKPPTIY
jgi:hypothetical protein